MKSIQYFTEYFILVNACKGYGSVKIVEIGSHCLVKAKDKHIIAGISRIYSPNSISLKNKKLTIDLK